MNKKLISFSFIATCAGFLMIGTSSCNNNNEKPEMTTVTTDSGSKMIDTGSMANRQDNTTVNNMDTAMASKMSKDSMSSVSKMNAGKKGKKGKVMIVMNQKPSSSSMDMDKEGIYNNVEVWPSYPGGQKALESFFENNIEYPQVATDNGTEGTVNISFAVDEKGKVSSPKVIGQKVGNGIDEEALRVFNKMPTWTPGQIKGKNVKTRFTLPVRFQLTD
ncbi:MAG: energy transducer TonB [Ferruginibacter sp.]